MEHTLFNSTKEFSLWGLVGVGLILVFSKVLSEECVQYLSQRKKDRILERQRLIPVIRAASELLSRIGDILIVRQADRRAIILKRQEVDTAKRVPNLSPLSMDRVETTAFALINFIALANRFRREIQDLPRTVRIDYSGYFLEHKIPMALRGNLFRLPLLSTEQQEEIAIRFCESAPSVRPVDITVGDFCKGLQSVFPVELFAACVDLFLVDTNPLVEANAINYENENWRKILVLSQLAVYLADFVQDLEGSSQWEELRFFCVRTIYEWNRGTTSPWRYIYEPGDIDPRNYVSTYPSVSEPLGLVRNLLLRVPLAFNVSKWSARVARRVALILRGGRYRRRHEPKAIRAWGVLVRRGKDWKEFRFEEPLQSLFLKIQAHLTHRW